MKGFDPKFENLPDYIYRITDEIWESRNVGPGIRAYYGESVPVRSPSGLIIGAEQVIAATLATLHEFPDRRLLGEDVVWSGDDETGFLSSHRILSTATHLGDGTFGPASGKPLRYRIIADCACKNNQVIDEWLIRDQAAIAYGLGTIPSEMADDQARDDMEKHGKICFFDADQDIDGPYRNVIQGNAIATDYAEKLLSLWNDADLAVIKELYSWSATIEAPGGVQCTGFDAIDRFYLGYLASFPTSQLTIDHLITRDDPGQPTRLAVRWTVRGHHNGRGKFGAPTGHPIYIMGISQAHIVDGKIVCEWLMIDEVCVWKQLISI